MTQMASLAGAGLAGLQQLLAPSADGTDTPVSEAPVDDQLRLLAVLTPILRTLLDTIAGSVTTSPVRATLLALLTEDIARLIGRAQIVAAGKIEDSDAHTLKEAPLAALHIIHANLTGFVEGTASLPADQCNGQGTKMLFRDATEMVRDQLHLSFSQSKQRLATRDLLLPSAGFNGVPVPPRFHRLSTVFNNGSADPAQVAQAAQRLLALQPGIDAQTCPEEAAELIEGQVAESLLTRNPIGTGNLLKSISARLDAQALERGESRMQPYLGLSFKGRQARGYIWEMCTDLAGHERLSKLADQLANPRSSFGYAKNAPSTPDTDNGGQPPLPGFPDDGPAPAAPTIPEAPTIPAWAIDPDVPEDQRPRAGFTDVGREFSVPEPAAELVALPGESTAEARQRAKARALLQFVFDSIRCGADGDGKDASAMPLKPNVDLIVTISWDSLVGKLNDPGITARNNLVSAGYVRRLACTANIIPAVLGSKSEPLDLGRKQRFFSRAQRRAMLLRDKGCINPGCTMPAHRCEANHIKPWYLGGETNLSNGGLLCPVCVTLRSMPATSGSRWSTRSPTCSNRSRAIQNNDSDETGSFTPRPKASHRATAPSAA